MKIPNVFARMIYATCLIACATPAAAEITYNYEQQWLFDSESALYWQYLAIPTSTFRPSYGSLANSTQLFELLEHADAAAIQGEPGDYSPSLANLLSFLSTNTPALPPSLQPDLNVGALYLDPWSAPPGHPELGHNYYYFSYLRIVPATSTWQFSSISTIGSYGPGYPCGNFPDCPDTQYGLVFSTAPPPVPLPGAMWLMVSALGPMLAWCRMKTIRPRRKQIARGDQDSVPEMT